MTGTKKVQISEENGIVLPLHRLSFGRYSGCQLINFKIAIN